MAYNIIVSPRAQSEIENAIDYYASNSVEALKNFISALQDAYSTLEINPFFEVQYKNIRSLKLHKFPFSLYFVINENKKMIRVLACFHHSRNPNKRPRK